DPEWRAVRGRQGEFGNSPGLGDAPNLIGPGLIEPQIPIRAGRYPLRLCIGRRYRKLSDTPCRGNPPYLARDFGEPDPAIRTPCDKRGRSPSSRDLELANCAACGDPTDPVAANFRKPKRAIRTRG